MKFDDVLTRMLGIQYPIIQGAFGPKGMGTSSIAVPVSEAGALGILTSVSYKDPDEFQQDVRDAKARTDKPFAVNFSLFKDRNILEEYHEENIKAALNEGIKTIFTSAYDGAAIAGGVRPGVSATLRVLSPLLQWAQLILCGDSHDGYERISGIRYHEEHDSKTEYIGCRLSA